MADYHAVLERTLSGFDNPKSELRSKLYDRARTTIRRQLENRTPPVTGDDLTAELDKLEQAIFQIERTYNPNYPEPMLDGSGVESAPAAAKEEETEAEEPAAKEPEAEEAKAEGEAPAKTSKPPSPEPQPVEQPEPPAPPPASVEPDEAVVAEASGSVPDFADTLAKTPPLSDPGPAMAEPEPAAIETETPQPEFEPLQPPAAVAEPVVDQSVAQENVDDAAVNQWAQEFLSQQPGDAQATPPAADPYTAAEPHAAEAGIPLPQELHPEPAQDTAWSPHPVADKQEVDSYQPTPHQPQAPAASDVQDLDQAFADGKEEELVIPPAAGFGSGGKPRSRKRGVFKWIFILLILGLLGAGGYYGWMNKDQLTEQVGASGLLEKVGLSHLLDDPTRPKPVKTIAITPEGETSQPSDDAIPAPKVESRLTESGEEETAPSASPTSAPTIQPIIETRQPEPSRESESRATQNAILYEEGATAAENTVDAGRVAWSVIEEEPASGAPKEPAIRARIEIPDRNVVLIMKIKRNADKALPASHLIELVFAVPDEFPGGAVDQVSRFVLKQSEQGRGDGLVGVPARIADGIFLIALNNLEQARRQNESLLQSREWIDIPLQYRTGRRALITIEKGETGGKVFGEVFDAWSKLAAANQ